MKTQIEIARIEAQVKKDHREATMLWTAYVALGFLSCAVILLVG